MEAAAAGLRASHSFVWLLSLVEEAARDEAGDAAGDAEGERLFASTACVTLNTFLSPVWVD